MQSLAVSGADGRFRTPNPQIRSLVLYPVELRPQVENIGGIILKLRQ